MRPKKSKGFTIVEVIVAVGIFSLIVYGVIALVSSIFNNSNQQNNLLVINDSARRAAFRIIGELRNTVTSATGSYALAQASDQQIIYYTNTGSSVDRIRYYIQNGNLYRGVVKPTGNPLVYDIGTETSTMVQNNIANGATPLFYYYDGTYNGVVNNPLTQPVNVTAVKFVKVNLMIYKKAKTTSTGIYTVTASGTIRNLKTNLGQ